MLPTKMASIWIYACAKWTNTTFMQLDLTSHAALLLWLHIFQYVQGDGHGHVSPMHNQWFRKEPAHAQMLTVSKYPSVVVFALWMLRCLEDCLPHWLCHCFQSKNDLPWNECQGHCVLLESSHSSKNKKIRQLYAEQQYSSSLNGEDCDM